MQMEPKDVKTLFLLEAIGKEDCQSQRDLSRKLNMSLGLVNAIIKKLSSRGFFKVVNLPKSGTRYLLTQKGVTERAKLSMRYTSYLVEFYKETKNRLQSGFDRLYDNGIQKIVLYGANELSEIACTLSKKPSQKVVAIIDSGKDGQRVNGIDICSEKKLPMMSFDAVIIMDSENTKKTKQKLIEMSVPADKIVGLFSLGDME